MAKQAGEIILAGLSVYLRSLRRSETLFHAGVVYPKKLCSPGNHIDVVVLPLGALPVHKSINWIVRIFVPQDGRTYLKQGRAQMWRPTL